MKKSITVVLSLLVSIALVLSACSSDSKSSSEKLLSSFEKSADIKSYNLNGSLSIKDLKLSDALLQEEEAASALAMLQNAELSWTGAYRADPMMMELTLKISISGDLAISFQVPFIITQEKMWIKVPNIPMLSLPADIVGKYIEFDLKELAEQQGAELPAALDVGKAMELAKELFGIVLKHVDEKTYLSSPSAKDAGIPDSANVKDVVQLHIEKDQVEPFVQTLIEKIAPEMLDLLASNEEYRSLTQLTPEQIDEAKKQLSELDETELKDGLAEFDKSVKTFDVVSNIGIDKDGYASYSSSTIKFEAADGDQSGSGTLSLVSEQTDINGEPKFEIGGEPKAEEVIPLEELISLFGFSMDAM
ncbi:hypothetical protein [Cohnella fermenti]|uniref:Lipoprotein n=1 Tax=Cohnella fermenti TaxID=2565925 RepID=A0A4S4BQE1_9BACL|nr:hypothetical protein [Cohnella fermenti]THF77149.1 hypothetical protein E6C55_17460 [Cohnella fermenti]